MSDTRSIFILYQSREISGYTCCHVANYGEGWYPCQFQDIIYGFRENYVIFQNHAISKSRYFQNHVIFRITRFSESRNFRITQFSESRYFQRHRPCLHNHAIFHMDDVIGENHVLFKMYIFFKTLAMTSYPCYTYLVQDAFGRL